MYRENKKKTLIYILSFFIPVVMMVIVAIVIQLFPFGSNSVLFSDINNQFVSFYSYFKTLISGNDNFIYTFSKNLGGDMIGFAGYYLQNPFLFILMLFPDQYLTAGILLMIILQIGFCGVTFQIYISEVNGYKKEGLIFSTAYAFMGYIFAYITLPIYFCNIILLPLVMLGIYRIVNRPNRKALYVITLALSIICNYYLGYMLCIFSVLYFIYMTLTCYIKKKKIFERVKSFLIASLLGVGLSAFDLIPIVLSLRGQKDIPNSSVLSLYRNFNFRDVFSKLYTNAYNGNLSNNSMPYIYVGIVTTVFIVLYFLNKEISKKERLYSAIFIVIMLCCCYIHTIDVIWHAFNEPVGFAYRYAFLISFLLLHIGYRGFLKYEPNLLSYLPVIIIMILYSAYLILFGNTDITKTICIVDLIIIVILGILLIIHRNYYLPMQLGFLILLALQCSDLLENAVWSVKQYSSVSQSEYQAYIEKVEPVIDQIKTEDQTFYRIEKNFQRNHNDAMQFAYNGLSHNSSCEKDYVKEFASKMGFRNFGIWAFYNEGSTSFVDCFLGVRYFISKYDTTNKPYVEEFHTDDTYVFRNPYALPLAFGMKEKILNIQMNQMNLFEIQNDTAKAFGTEDNIYTKASVTKTTMENLTKKSIKDGEEEYTSYCKIEDNKEAYIEYEITASQNSNLFFYFAAPQTQDAEILVNDYSYGDYFSNWRWNIVNAGNYLKNDIVKIRINVLNKEMKLYESYFYEENPEKLKTWYETAKTETGELEKISSSHLKGTITLNEDEYLVFSIPYEKGWNIIIDGEKVKQEEVMDALIAVKLLKGNHIIDMYYIPEGFFTGLIISLISLIIFVFILLNYHHNMRNKY